MKNRVMYLPLFCLLAASCLFSTSARAQNGGGWQVVKADWGAGRRWMDVTRQVRRLVNGNGRFVVNNDTMGGDPAYGVLKILRIQATNSRGQSQQFTYNEDSTVNARQFSNNGGSGGPGYPGNGYPGSGYPGNPGPPLNPGYPGGGNGSLQITRAYYGLNNRTMDVTQLLRGMVRNGTLAVQVNNNNMGGDPVRGGDKVLTVIYRFRGQERTSTVKEGNVLRIP
jgi:hypothetical protein